MCQIDLLVPALDFSSSREWTRRIHICLCQYDFGLQFTEESWWCMHSLEFFVIVYAAYNFLLKSKAKQRKRNRSYPECLFWQLSLMHYFKNTYFYYVHVMAVSVGKSHEHSTGYKVWYIQCCLDCLDFFFPVVYTQQILIIMSCMY